MEEEKEFYDRLEKKGITRRDFMKYCTFLTATLGLSSTFIPKVAEVFAASGQRPPVIWLHFAECTGCSEAMLRSQYPYPDDLVLEILSAEYHETIMAAAGHQAEDNLKAAVKKYKGRRYWRYYGDKNNSNRSDYQNRRSSAYHGGGGRRESGKCLEFGPDVSRH